MQIWDEIVIGGGVVGASVAYHLAAGGSTVHLVEATAVGQGSTVASVGGLRSVHRHPLEAALSLESVEGFDRLEHDAGVDLGFRPAGQLLLAGSDARADALRAGLANAERLGVDARELTPTEVKVLVPDLDAEAVQSASFAPGDRWCAHPEAAATAYAKLAVARGAAVSENCRVLAVMHDAHGVVVETNVGVLRARSVIVAAGAWFRRLLEPLGVDLAAWAYPRHVYRVSTESPAALGPVAVFQDDDLYLRTEDDGTRLVVVGQSEQTTTDVTHDPSRFEEVRRRIQHRCRSQVTGVTHAWSGLRCLTPDRRAIVGPIPDQPGLWAAVGFSGHGFMHAPAVGQHLAARLLDGDWGGLNLDELRPDRFDPHVPPPVSAPGHQ